jgi:Tfp pilus assembly protein PilN
VSGKALETVTDWLTTSANDFEGNLTEFAESVQALQSDKEALARLSEFELVEQGCALVDDHTARCPLCRGEYDQGELVPRLDARRRRLQRIEERVKAVQQRRNTLQSQIDSPIQSLRQLTDHLPSSVVGIPLDPLSELHEQLTAVENEFEHDMVNETESINVEVLSGGIEFDEPMRCPRTECQYTSRGSRQKKRFNCCVCEFQDHADRKQRCAWSRGGWTSSIEMCRLSKPFHA